MTDIVEPPFTPISLEGVSELDWALQPWRYKSETTSPEWNADGSDGGLLAGPPSVVARCTAPTPPSSWNKAPRGKECVGINGSLVLAQSSAARNGVVQWNVTLKGLHDSYQSVLEIRAVLVLQFDPVIHVMEDYGRDPKLAYSPQMLAPQVTPCSLRYSFVGNLAAPASMAALQFSFDAASSYSGSTSILILQQTLPCMQELPTGGMEVEGDGVCRNLTLRTHPDSSGTLDVTFNVTLNTNTGLEAAEHTYKARLAVSSANDQPAFRFNCSTPVRPIAPAGSAAQDAYGRCVASCGNPASVSGEGVCENLQNWRDGLVPGDKDCEMYQKDPWRCASNDAVYSTNCGINVFEACCVCGGGRRDRPLYNARDCSMSISVYQMTDAASLTAVSTADASVASNSSTAASRCRGVQVERAAVGIVSAFWQAADEAHQQLTFVLVPLFANYSRVFSRDALPSIDAATGTLTICLEPGKTFGSVPLDVFLYDDGGQGNGGVDFYGPARLNLEVLSTNQEPSFDLCCGSVLHVVESSGHHFLENFLTNIAKGERDQEGVDLEELQDVTFAVSVSPLVQAVAFTAPPRVHVDALPRPCASCCLPGASPLSRAAAARRLTNGAFVCVGCALVQCVLWQANGTLEFGLAQDWSGVVEVNFTVTDDGGWDNGGVNTSAVATLHMVVSGAYLELVLSTCEGEIDDQATMCDIAQDLEIPCSMMFKRGPATFRVHMGSADALVPVAQRAALLHTQGRGPLPRGSAAGNELSSRDNATASDLSIWDKWMLPGGTSYLRQNCSSDDAKGPSCQVQMGAVPARSLLFLTVDVFQTDFSDNDEYIKSVAVSDRKLGDTFLVSGGSDEDCEKSARILELRKLDPSLLTPMRSLSVNITASDKVGFYQCGGSTLLAKITLVANCLFVESFQVPTQQYTTLHSPTLPYPTARGKLPLRRILSGEPVPARPSRVLSLALSCPTRESASVTVLALLPACEPRSSVTTWATESAASKLARITLQ